jgi:hypothetical protein
VHLVAEPYEVPPPAADAGAPDAGGSDGGGCGPAVPAAVGDLALIPSGLGAEGAELRFSEPPAPAWPRVTDYEIRYWNGDDRGEAAFAEGTPAHLVLPVSPAGSLTFTLSNLKALSRYTVAVRPRGLCLDPQIRYLTFTTVKHVYTQLSGCFIATAAWGSPTQPAVAKLRRARDWAVARSSLATAVAALYARASPPLAAVIAGDDSVRAVVRRALAPLLMVP